MEQHDMLEQFEAIEGKVQRIIEVCKALESEKLEHSTTIERLEKELREKTEAEQSYIEERAQIRSRVESLLGKLADIAQG